MIIQQSSKVKITPLVINSLGGGHTHILWWNESDFKKPGALAYGWRVPGLNFM